MNEEISLTHTTKDRLSKEEVQEKFEKIKKAIAERHQDKPIELEELNRLLEELCDSEFGRFLIYNKGALSGYWTYYIIMGFNTTPVINMTERFLLEKAPAILATRERFSTFQRLLSKTLKENSIVCSVPCGVMADFATLKINEGIKNIQFVGIDLDSTVFEVAKTLMQKHGKSTYSYSFFHKDAWRMDEIMTYDAITSNGLNIYEKDDSRVIALYKVFFNSLKPGGVFIGSSLSRPDDWDRSRIDENNLQLQRKIFAHILEATWQNYRAASKSASQLVDAGFSSVKFYWDSQRIFYTFKAKKPKTALPADPTTNSTNKSQPLRV